MKIEKLSIAMLWFAAAFDPIGKLFFIRYIALGLTFFVIIKQYFLGRKTCFIGDYQIIFISAMLVIMPLYGFIIYIFKSRGGEFTDTSYIAAGLLMTTTLVYDTKLLCDHGIKCLNFISRMLAAVVVIVFIFEINPENSWLSYLIDRDVAIIGIRQYGVAETPYIYFLASPILVFALASEYQNLLLRGSLISGIAFLLLSTGLFLSGTRAHIIIAIFYILLYHFLDGSFNKSISFFLVVVAFVFAFELNNFVFEIGNFFFSTSETSNQIKIQLLTGYSSIFSNPINFIFGQGYNAHEWSPEVVKMTSVANYSKTELTYIEIIRVYGIIIGGSYCILLVMFLKQTQKLSDKYRWVFPGILILLINSAVNPYLFSTNGCLPLALSLAILNFGTRTSANDN